MRRVRPYLVFGTPEARVRDALFVDDRLAGLTFKQVAVKHGVSSVRAQQRFKTGAPYFLFQALALRAALTQARL